MENTTKTALPWKSGPTQAPLPPLAPGLPLVGGALEMYTDVLGYLLRQHRRMGPIFRIKVLNETYTVIAGQDANLFMTRAGNEHFRSKEFWEGMDREMGGGASLISTDGELHTRMRQAMKRGFSRAMIEQHLGDVVAVVRKALDSWPLGETRAVYPFLQDVITEQLGVIVAGRAPGDYVPDVVRFVRSALLVRVTRQRPAFLLALPGYKKAKRRTFALGQQIVDWHKANPPVDRAPDLIDDVIEAARGGLFREQDLAALALGPYIAGLDTAASTAAFFLYALFKHPRLLERVQAEADQLLAAGPPDPADLRQADVLQRVLLETLRRYPIAPAVQRTVTRPFEFHGCRVEAGQRIFIGTTLAHFDPALHPDPERFDIDRYLPERKEHRIPGAFAPFSLGAHTCLGAGLAEVQIMLTMAALLRCARFEMAPPGYELQMRTAPTPAPAPSFKMRLVEKK